MATILLAWELGGGLGHFMNLRPLADGLARRGHRVVAVLRDLSTARRFLSNSNVAILQAPFKHQRMTEIEPTCTFAQILYNCGFGDAEGLTTLAEAWRQLYEYVKPDLIVFDHSPTAILAGRGLSVRRALIGTGFFSPPDISPLPNLRTWMTPDSAALIRHESQVLDNINSVLIRWNEKAIERVAHLYQPLDKDFLLTFRELDCYSEHRGLSPFTTSSEKKGTVPLMPQVEYWGGWNAGMGDSPNWPHGRGRKIFAYLKPFPALGQLLAALDGLPNPSLIYAPVLDPRLRAECRNPTVRFADAPVEMGQVARECDLAILNGTHATTAAMLLAGKPALHIPIFLEQAVNAKAAERLGAAICVPPSDAKGIVNALASLLSSDRFAKAAQGFAARYADFTPDLQIERMINRAEELAMLPQP